MQECEATHPSENDPGWTCDGTRLVVIMTEDGPIGASGVPAVIREDLVWLMGKPERGLLRRYGSQPFAGGDHLHLCVRGD